MSFAQFFVRNTVKQGRSLTHMVSLDEIQHVGSKSECLPRKKTFLSKTLQNKQEVAAGFGQHGMSPPASNDTGTAFCFPN